MRLNALSQRISRFDPTKTLILRHRAGVLIRHRFGIVAKAIRNKILKEDFFARRTRHILTFAEGELPLDPVKVAQFIAWLREQIENNILEVILGTQIGSAINPAWQGLYIQTWLNPVFSEAYVKGMDRALMELRKAGYAIKEADVQVGASLSEFSRRAIHADRVGVVYSRMYSALQGITADMDARISNILALGIAQGTSINELVQKLVGEVGLGAERAERIARTEIVRAYNWAAIQQYRNYGVLGIRVMVEWLTAGDDRVCPDCSALEGEILSLDDAEKLIPLHLSCRCFVLPLTVD